MKTHEEIMDRIYETQKLVDALESKPKRFWYNNHSEKIAALKAEKNVLDWVVSRYGDHNVIEQ